MALDLAFTNVIVGVNDKVILRHVSGRVEPASMLALMGATGSGKTTLLSTLSNRLEAPARLSASSQILFSGRAWSKSLKRLVGFVEQDDVVIPELTVRQTLEFAARLRIPGEDLRPKLARVDAVVKQLALVKCVGTKIKAMSGGERKRVCIAVELLASPRLLFLDEPTSGLDSETALTLVKSLRNLAAVDGVTIVCSIHQPNSQVFRNFQQLCFLHAGRQVFFGDAQDESLRHFESLGFPCPLHHNPPDWFMEVAVNGLLDDSSASLSVDYKTAEDTGQAPDEAFQAYSVPFTEQVAVLTERMYIRTVRSVGTWSNFISFIGIGLVFAGLFFGLGRRDTDAYPRVALCFVFVIQSCWWPVMETLPSFDLEATTLKKELSAGAHRLSAFYIGRVTTLQLACTVISWTPNFVIFFSSLWKYITIEQTVLFVLVCMLVVASFLAIGICLTAAVPPKHLFMAAMTFLMYAWSYSGLFVPVGQMYPWLRWLVRVNPFTISLHLVAHIILDYGPREYVCTGDALAFEALCAESATEVQPGRLSIEDIKAEYDITTPAPRCVAFLLLYWAAGHSAAYCLLRRRCAAWLE